MFHIRIWNIYTSADQVHFILSISNIFEYFPFDPTDLSN